MPGRGNNDLEICEDYKDVYFGCLRLSMEKCWVYINTYIAENIKMMGYIGFEV